MRIILDNPSINVIQVKDGEFKLTFTENNIDLELELSEMNLKALGLELIRVCPVIKPEIKLDGSNDSYRYLASDFKDLDDRSIQLWLREVQSDSLIYFLWFMKDREIIERVFKNMSARAAEMLLEDLTAVANSRGDPDSPRANKNTLVTARQEVQSVISILNRLKDEGQIV